MGIQFLRLKLMFGNQLQRERSLQLLFASGLPPTSVSSSWNAPHPSPPSLDGRGGGWELQVLHHSLFFTSSLRRCLWFRALCPISKPRCKTDGKGSHAFLREDPPYPSKSGSALLEKGTQGLWALPPFPLSQAPLPSPV